MDKQTIAVEELKIVEEIINYQESIRFKFLGWLITIISAISVAFLSSKLNISQNSFLLLSTLIIMIFLWLDTIHRVAVDRAIERAGKIERYLRAENKKYDGPKIGESISIKNGIKYQIIALANIRVYSPYLALFIAVLVIYFF